MIQVTIPKEIVIDFWLRAKKKHAKITVSGHLAFQTVTSEMFKEFLVDYTGLNCVQLPANISTDLNETRWVVEVEDEEKAVMLRLTDYQELRDLKG